MKMSVTDAEWRAPSSERTAHVIARRELVQAADRLGAVAISAPILGRRAGVGGRTAWRWLRGISVSREADAALRRALGLPIGRRVAA